MKNRANKYTKKRCRRRYYLHSKVRKQNGDTVKVDARGKMIYIPFSIDEPDKYSAILQSEFDYGIQKEIR